MKPVQIVQDCYNQGTTPKFNFAKECGENNFVRSCKFSPTGSHLITDSVDRRVRVFAFEDDKVKLLLNSLFTILRLVESEEVNTQWRPYLRPGLGPVWREFCNDEWRVTYQTVEP